MKSSVLFWQERLKAVQLFTLSLAHMKGVGCATSFFSCASLGFSKFHRLGHISAYQRNFLVNFFFEKFLLGRQLDRDRSVNFLNLARFGLYRTKRRYMKLPVRGQRTHSNASTARRVLF